VQKWIGIEAEMGREHRKGEIGATECERKTTNDAQERRPETGEEAANEVVAKQGKFHDQGGAK
jgi:hypothetical protein